LIIKSPSLTSSSDPEKIPDIPAFFDFLEDKNLFGINLLISFQSVSELINDLILLIPSSVEKIGNIGMLIF